MDPARLRAAYEQVKQELLAERTLDGHWVGELSSSALATATAVSALAVASRVQSPKSKVQSQEPLSLPSTLDLGPWTLDSLISRGIRYLASHQNPDGGFGDTDLSHSNIATTYLVVAALHLAGVADQHEDLLARANAYIESKRGLAGLRERYGIDKTFVVPIMTNLALAGLLDWREIDPLPFELACVPQSLYRFVGMPVVSYAIPALVAIGQARYHHAPPRNPFTRLIRWLSITRSLQVLRRMQPDSGGYLEATPLTSFVVMSLASSRHAPRDEPRSSNQAATSGHVTRSVTATLANEVIRHGVQFLANSIRPDGSWPIDTNLATWNTTLAINALAGAGEDVAALLGPKCLDWLLSCQNTKQHPFTGADPGGFGWSDLSGAVPDADDTAGGLLAVFPFNSNKVARLGRSALWYRTITIALRWLLSLQNVDGGWPTFCRGWGRLPFDRSGNDLTAHVVRSIAIWKREFRRSERWQTNIRNLGGGWPQDRDLFGAIRLGLDFVKSRQHPDGSWSPLWFGNQDHPQEDNPVYGTSKVLFAYRDLGLMDSPEARRGVAWLVDNQNADGGWGSGVWGRVQSADCGSRSGGQAEPGGKAGVESGHGVTGSDRSGHSIPDQPKVPLIPEPRAPSPLLSSVEETALAVEALLAACPPSPDPQAPSPVLMALEKGLTWLALRVERGEHRQPAPIGFYFAKLWYYERLYPLTFTVAALGRACREYASRPHASLTLTDSDTPASTGTTPWTTAAP